MKNKLLTAFSLLFITLFTSISHAQQSWSPEHVYYGRGGTLTYTPDDLGNVIPDFSHVGIFWQDGVANTAMFYFLNQGIIMRFLATKSLRESRKAALAMVVLLMTTGAMVVGGRAGDDVFQRVRRD